MKINDKYFTDFAAWFLTIKELFSQNKSRSHKSQRGQNTNSSEHVPYTRFIAVIPVSFSRLRENSRNKMDWIFKTFHYSEFLSCFSSKYTHVVNCLFCN